MTQIPVSSLEDPRLAPYRNLNQRNLTRQSGLFIAEGQKVVDRLIESSFEIDSILAEPAYADRYEQKVAADVPIYIVARDLLEATIGFNFHRGILACGRRQPRTSIDPLLTQTRRASEGLTTQARSVSEGSSTQARRASEGSAAGRQTILICPEIHDPTNLGSLVRTAAALGCACLVLGSRCADPFSRRVLRVSMGAALYLPIIEAVDLAADIRTLRASNFELIAAVLDPTAEALHRASRPERLAILLGNEAHGLAEEWLSLTDRRVTIPMHENVDSLNLTIAAAILLYHFSSGPE
jgi:tRNA G18 (ribose-2'-O)-methylase SpoU